MDKGERIKESPSRKRNIDSSAVALLKRRKDEGGRMKYIRSREANVTARSSIDMFSP
jgi:hypothetical protein